MNQHSSLVLNPCMIPPSHSIRGLGFGVTHPIIHSAGDVGMGTIPQSVLDIHAVSACHQKNDQFIDSP